MTILIMVIVAFILWHFIPQRPPKADPRFHHDPRITASNPDWWTAVEGQCESPAESAFLRAMITSHGLRPSEGSLSSSDLKLDLQVGLSNYRADFLVNNWLVVEIDGAEWHSSPAQQSRDAVRDDHFQELGYAVLRIPAKTVFQRPSDAVNAVSTRLKRGKPQLAEHEQLSGFERIATTIRDISSGVSQMNRGVELHLARASAMRAANDAFASERRALELAMEVAEKETEIDELCDTLEKRERFARHSKTTAAIFAQSDASATTSKAIPRIIVTEMVRPDTHDNSETHAATQAWFDDLLRERDKMYANARKTLERDVRLRPHAMKWLLEMECPTVAERLHGLQIDKGRSMRHWIDWRNTLIYGAKIAPDPTC